MMLELHSIDACMYDVHAEVWQVARDQAMKNGRGHDAEDWQSAGGCIEAVKAVKAPTVYRRRKGYGARKQLADGQTRQKAICTSL